MPGKRDAESKVCNVIVWKKRLPEDEAEAYPRLQARPPILLSRTRFGRSDRKRCGAVRDIRRVKRAYEIRHVAEEEKKNGITYDR